MWPVQPALVARIEAAIRKFRASDPFLPIHVIVSNHVLGTLLGRSLFADAGYLAIEVQLPHEFAWSLAAQESLHSGLLPVPEDVDLAIVLKAAATAVSDKSTPDYLRNAAPMPGFASAASVHFATSRVRMSRRRRSRPSPGARRTATRSAC